MKRVVIVLIVVIALAAVLGFGVFSARYSRDVDNPNLGKAMPSFEMPLFDRYAAEYGDSFSFTEHVGKPMVINFWASWCGPCKYEAPILEAAWQEYQGEVLFVGVDTLDSSRQDATAFLERFELSFPNGIDQESHISIDYGLFGVPETYFIHADGTLSNRHTGPLTAEVLQEQIQVLLQ